MNKNETIVAQATALGKGSVGIIRVSGEKSKIVAEKILGKIPKPRMAEYLGFYDENQQLFDRGIAIFFPNPHSFTGEDVLELQGHGGPIVLDLLIQQILLIPGIRMARPGEFSERAFLNDKIDLAQAEAIADLIEASSEQAARSAMRSLSGEFSNKINKLVDLLIQLRTFVEASIDFSDEDIDFLSDGKIETELNTILMQIERVENQAKQGKLLRDGMKVVIAGKPNAGKSSLLNALTGENIAIVTNIAGTTRDVLREQIHIDGMPLHIIDTAGLRETEDEIERIGISRALNEIQQADHLIWIIDGNSFNPNEDPFLDQLFPENLPKTILINKVDLLEKKSIEMTKNQSDLFFISAKTGEGIFELKNHLKQKMGFLQTNESNFIARRRHIEALKKANFHVNAGKIQLIDFAALELLAEELRLAQNALSEITGEFSSDDLLGKIFSSFCIGK